MLDEVIFCDTCLVPSTRPRITFTGKTCNACQNNKNKKEIDWDKRKKEFIRIIDSNLGKNNKYDCIELSGGKDSSMIAYILKFEFNLNPLLITFTFNSN